MSTERKPNPSSTGYEPARMIYPDPKIAAENRKKGYLPVEGQAVMGPRMEVEPKTGKVRLAKPPATDPSTGAQA